MKKLWGIRHARWFWHSWRVHQAAYQWARMGIGLGYPAKSDLEVLDAIWEGKR